MRLTVRLDGRFARRWHLDLLSRLAARPATAVTVDPAPGEAPLPAGVDLLFRFERLIHGLQPTGPATPVPRAALDPHIRPAAAPPDLTLDLLGDVAPAAHRVWRLTFDGAPGEPGLLEALLDGRTPTAAIVEGDAIVAAGRLGTEYGGIALAAFEDMLARTITLVMAALAGGACATLPPLPAAAPSPTPAGSSQLAAPALARRAAREVARRVVQRLYHLAYHAPHWRTGWRTVQGADLIDLRRHPEGGWRDLPDDGRRFYADPFPIMHAGAVTLFVEDFPHQLARASSRPSRSGRRGRSGGRSRCSNSPDTCPTRSSSNTRGSSG